MAVIHSLYREPGTVKIDEENCLHCGACASICPTGVLTMDDDVVRISYGSGLSCIACGHCMMVCPEGNVTVSGRGLSPEDLRPMPTPEDRATSDALAALMLSRRSVRHFTDQEVEPELLARVVETAAMAPMSIPPWDIGCVTVRGRDKVRQLAEELIKGYQGFLRIFKPWLLAVMRPFVGRVGYEQFKYFVRPLAEHYVQSHRESRDTLLHDAPAVLIFHHSPYADAADAFIACTYAMLAAESLGLGSTMIGGAPPVLKRNKALCQRLGLPEGNTPAIALVLGYPAVRFERAIRRSFLG